MKLEELVKHVGDTLGLGVELVPEGTETMPTLREICVWSQTKILLYVVTVAKKDKDWSVVGINHLLTIARLNLGVLYR